MKQHKHPVLNVPKVDTKITVEAIRAATDSAGVIKALESYRDDRATNDSAVAFAAVAKVQELRQAGRATPAAVEKILGVIKDFNKSTASYARKLAYVSVEDYNAAVAGTKSLEGAYKRLDKKPKTGQKKAGRPPVVGLKVRPSKSGGCVITGVRITKAQIAKIEAYVSRLTGKPLAE